MLSSQYGADCAPPTVLDHGTPLTRAGRSTSSTLTSRPVAVAEGQAWRPVVESVAVTLVVHEHKRLGRGLDLAALAEQLRAAGIGLEFLTANCRAPTTPPA